MVFFYFLNIVLALLSALFFYSYGGAGRCKRVLVIFLTCLALYQITEAIRSVYTYGMWGHSDGLSLIGVCTLTVGLANWTRCFLVCRKEENDANRRGKGRRVGKAPNKS